MKSSPPLAIPESVAQTNHTFLTARTQLTAQICHGESGLKTAIDLRAITDQWLCALWKEVLPAEYGESVSLHATGGYGRDELAFHSDIDVLIALHDPALVDDPNFELAIERLMAWTRHTRLRLSHAVRTAAQAEEALVDDMRSAIALLDLRQLCGPVPPEEFGRQRVLTHLRGDDEGRSFVHALFEGHRQRVARHGETVFLLEPDVKNGEGGMRDLNCLAWAAAVRWQIEVRSQLFDSVGWSEELRDEYVTNLDALLSLRNRLHLLRGRKHDRMSFRDQEALIRMVKLTADSAGEDCLKELQSPLHDDQARAELYPDIEVEMGNFYRRARRISTACERCLRHWIAADDSPSNQLGAFVQRGEQLATDTPELLSDTEIFDALVIAGEKDLLLDPRLEAHIEARVQHWPSGDDCPRELTFRMRDLLVDPEASWRTSQRMLELGILQRIVPEFEKLVCHVQHDLYHVYTTDIHSLKCLEAGRALLSTEPREERWPFFAHVASQIEDTTSFLLGCLFHDIGKNRGGNHSERGARLMEAVAPRLGLDEVRIKRLVFLVRHHLDLSTTSRRRDISDPAIVGELAARIGTVECLNELTALTCCDMATVGPEVMNDWNASLLTELYHHLREALEFGPTRPYRRDPAQREKRRQDLEHFLFQNPAIPAEHKDKFIDDMPLEHLLDTDMEALLRQYETFCRAIDDPDGISVSFQPLADRGVTEVIVSAPDQPGTLARIAGAIASTGVNIMAADIVTTTQHQTLDIFHIAHFNPRAVPPAQPRPVEGESRLERIGQRIADVLCGRVDVEEVLERRREEQRLTPRQVPSVPTEVRLASDVSERFTVIEVHAPDRLGLLYTIASTLLQCRVNTRVSRIDSVGNKAIDTFYIEEWDSEPLTPERIDEVVTALQVRLESDET